MLMNIKDVRIFIRPGKTDFRKAVNGLSILVQESMGLDPFCVSPRWCGVKYGGGEELDFAFEFVFLGERVDEAGSFWVTDDAC